MNNVNMLEARGLKFLAREGSSDEKTFREVVERKTYERRYFQLETGEKWLDLGGNVGAFSVLAASKGCEVLAFEPDPCNVELLRQNLSINGLKAEVRQAAIVHDDRASATLNLWPGGQSWRNSIVRSKKGVQPVEVPCANFFRLAAPESCVKMDIEGAEIALLEAWPEGFRVKKLVFEYSFDVDPSVARLRAILSKMRRAFPTVKYSSQLERLDEWRFFPPATMVHCF